MDMYNLLSLALGLLAWGMGIAAICKKGCPWCVFGSMASCGVSLVLQFYDIARLADIPDFAAIQDTGHALAGAAALLLAVTITLNAAALLRGAAGQHVPK